MASTLQAPSEHRNATSGFFLKKIRRSFHLTHEAAGQILQERGGNRLHRLVDLSGCYRLSPCVNAPINRGGARSLGADHLHHQPIVWSMLLSCLFVDLDCFLPRSGISNLSKARSPTSDAACGSQESCHFRNVPPPIQEPASASHKHGCHPPSQVFLYNLWC